MVNKLTTLEKSLPLKAYTKEDLNKRLLMDFMPYLTRLLSLTDEVSANRLEIALPAIRDRCWGMGFDEIKKMFEMYVDSKLEVKPIPNYFDRIMFGKIVDSYLKNKPKKNIQIENKMTKEEKEQKVVNGCFRIFKQFKDFGKITDTCDYIYDYLYDLNHLPKDKLYKKAIFAKATLKLKSDAMTRASESLEFHRQLKRTISEIEDGKAKSKIISISKKLVLEDYFSKINKLKL